jgi:hypothetical protein
MEDLGVDGRSVLQSVLKEIEWKCVKWLYVAQDRDQWLGFVNMVQKFGLNKTCRIYSQAEKIIAAEDRDSIGLPKLPTLLTAEIHLILLSSK